MTRFTYRTLIELVGDDTELIERLLEEGVIERRGGDTVVVDVDRVLLVRTLWRDLDVDWPGIEVILKLRDELDRALRRVAELERKHGG